MPVPSSMHQWLVIWIARRMIRDGFEVSGFDGRAPRGVEFSQMPRPMVIEGVRADAWGQRIPDQLLAVGEAKTVTDVDTKHTREQLKVLGRIRMKGFKVYCPLYVAVPRSAAYKLDRVLIDTGLISEKHIVRLHIPDVLLEDCPDGARETFRTSA